MNSPILGLKVSSIAFGLMALAHLIRILLGLGVQIGPHLVGRRWSLAAIVVLGALCAWLWMLAARAARPKEPGTP